MQQAQKPNKPYKKWLKRFGVGGLIFFTLKGIAWLVVLYFGVELFRGCGG